MPPKSNKKGKGKGDSSKPKAPKGKNTDSKSSKQSTLSSFVNAKPKKKSMRKAAPVQNNRGEEIRGPEVLTGPDYVSALESMFPCSIFDNIPYTLTIVAARILIPEYFAEEHHWEKITGSEEETLAVFQ